MKNLLYLFLITFLFSCSSSDDEFENVTNDEQEMNPDSSDNFTISLSSEMNSLEIDEETEVTFSSSESIESIEISTDDFETSTLLNLAGGTDYALCVSFRESGNKNLRVKAQSSSGSAKESSLNFNVDLGMPVKIIGVRLYSFFNINQTWDDEFNEDDPNRLADVLVFLGKIDCSYQGGNVNTFHFTSIIQNVSEELFWDLDHLNLYVGLDKEVRIDVLDDDPGEVNYDEGVFVSVIDNGTNNGPRLNVSNHLAEKPESIRFTEDQDNGYDLEIYLEWIE